MSIKYYDDGKYIHFVKLFGERFRNYGRALTIWQQKLLNFRSPRTCQSGVLAYNMPLGISLQIFKQCA